MSFPSPVFTTVIPAFMKPKLFPSVLNAMVKLEFQRYICFWSNFYIHTFNEIQKVLKFCPTAALGSYGKEKLNADYNHCVESVVIRSNSVQIRENTDQNISEYGHFSGSEHRPCKGKISEKFYRNLLIF